MDLVVQIPVQTAFSELTTEGRGFTTKETKGCPGMEEVFLGGIMRQTAVGYGTAVING